MRSLTQRTKKKRKMGQGHGKNYIAGLSTREFSSHSTRSDYPHPLIGRNVALMSCGERDFFLHLLWHNDDVEEIREQFPLPIEITEPICTAYGIRHPRENRENCLVPFTVDLFVTRKDKAPKAYSIKYSEKDLENHRTVEKLFIEKKAVHQIGAEYELVFRDTGISRTEAMNLRLVYSRYDISEVHNEADLVLYMIGHKKIPVSDIESVLLDPASMAAQYFSNNLEFQEVLEYIRKEEECLTLKI